MGLAKDINSLIDASSLVLRERDCRSTVGYYHDYRGDSSNIKRRNLEVPSSFPGHDLGDPHDDYWIPESRMVVIGSADLTTDTEYG